MNKARQEQDGDVPNIEDDGFITVHPPISTTDGDPAAIRTDFENLQDGQEIILHPNETNPLHSKPVKAQYSRGYFFCVDGDPVEGPDYYFGDVLTYCHGFTIASGVAA